MHPFGLDEIAKSLPLRRKSLAAGARLFRRGDPAAAVYWIEKGRIALVRYTVEGSHVRLFTAGPGESFAEAALFSDVYHCDAVAEVATRVVVVPKAALRGMLRRQRPAAEKFMTRLAHQVHDLRQRLELRSVRSARERVWRYLVTNTGEDGTTVLVRGTLMELAADLGLAHEVLYRTLANLAASGKIERWKGRIRLTRPIA
jgi:CRP/FNR family transcriptional regulator, dissimilatory nitrate respiration regulator